MTTMTPSEVGKQMTDKQVDKAVDLYRAMLRKEVKDLSAAETQIVLGDPSYVAEQGAVLRNRVAKISNMIVRRVKVDRNRTPQQVLDATGRVQQYTDRKFVATMPNGEGEEVDVYFFKLDRYMSPTKLDREYEARGLKPDPYAQAKVNEDDPTFADEHPNGTQWGRDAEGNASFVSFSRWGGERSVYVSRGDDVWSDRWFVGGVRK